MKEPNASGSGEILVIGGNGKTGRRVVERLQKAGQPVRVGSRSSPTPFDWDAPETWAAALRGASAAYITYYPDLALPGAADAIGKLAAVALGVGVKRLVLLSGRGEEGAQRAEDALKASGAEWTIVRASWFMQNFSENFMVDSILAGELALPVGEVREPFIDVDDIADVAVAALRDRRHIGQLYEVTGSRLMTFGEALNEIGQATGREVRFVTVPLDDFIAGMRAQQVPQDFIDLLTHLFRDVLDGRNAYIADGVERALGRPPRDFDTYARETAAAGTWQVPV